MHPFVQGMLCYIIYFVGGSLFIYFVDGVTSKWDGLPRMRLVQIMKYAAVAAVPGTLYVLLT